MRTKYLPPGSMRAQRRRGRIEGSAATLFLCALLGFLVLLMTPRELYNSPHPTPAEKKPEPLKFDRAPLPPCNDMQEKDCMATNKTHLVHTVPEPSTLWLAIVGAAAAAHRKIIAAIGAVWIAYGEWRGMDIGDE
mgnify:CR=1 FL=1